MWLRGAAKCDTIRAERCRIFRTRETHEYLKEVWRHLGDESLTERDFRENRATSVKAREKRMEADSSEPVRKHPKSRRGLGNGGLWNSTDYDVKNGDSIDMMSC